MNRRIKLLYTVHDINTGDLIIRDKTAQEAATALGIKVQSFRYYACYKSSKWTITSKPAIIQGSNSFGGRLKYAIMVSRYQTMTHFAKSLHYSYGTVLAWCADKTYPSGDSLILIAKTLDISLDWLFGLKKDMKLDSPSTWKGE